ncbi:MAG TPA: SDR family oxidoreductase [Candidatus Sulfopaludibacter sp.]|jgi:NADP-dependent 3-hydroxy acid dehydrogenase YdfG|nr:SDR family oxidoreductase [Candidatus Sulfopaludibacter sp.]
MIQDKIVLITGAGSGSYSTAMTLSKEGAKIVAGARRIERLEELKKSVESQGGEIIIQKLDVTKLDDCNNFAKIAVKRYGNVDILVNNAGIMPLSFFKNQKIDEWDRMVDVNIKGVFYCTSAVIPYMLNNKYGHIVNISSTAGRIVFPAGSVYCATKHAITAFSEGLRQEFSQRSNIRVACIELGVVATELTNTITDSSLESFIKNTKKMEPLQAEDIANSILYVLQSPYNVNVNEIMLRPISQER